MTHCNEQHWFFQDLGTRKVEVDFGGGYLSSDGGGLVLRELERHSGLIRALADCFVDHRDPRYIEHRLEELLAQRIHGLALGYEDLNDHDHLRLRSAASRAVRQKRSAGPGAGLAPRPRPGAGRPRHAQPLGIGRRGPRWPLPQDRAAARQDRSAVDRARRQGPPPRRSAEIVLDFDATDDPLHGNQQGAYFHGYYGHYCYLPLYCFCGNIPLLAQLRDCKRDAGAGTVEALQKIVPMIRQRFGPHIRIVVRADSGFARDALMSWCEANGVFYCVGLARNERLQKELQASFEGLKAQIKEGTLQSPCRSFTEFEYATRDSWSRARRVIGKAEVLAEGDNPRFIVTNLPADGWGEPAQAARFAPAALYEKLYCARGDMENRIKEQQLDLFADRTSTHWLASNQLRLWFSAFAHLMLSPLQAEVLAGTELAGASIGQIRLRLFKIAARVRVSVRRIHIELCSAYPLKALFDVVHQRLRALPSAA